MYYKYTQQQGLTWGSFRCSWAPIKSTCSAHVQAKKESSHCMSAKAKSVPPTCHSSNMHSEDVTQRRAILAGQGSLVLDGVEIQEFSTSPTSPNLKLDRVEVDGRQLTSPFEECKVRNARFQLLSIACFVWRAKHQKEAPSFTGIFGRLHWRSLACLWPRLGFTLELLPSHHVFRYLLFSIHSTQ